MSSIFLVIESLGSLEESIIGAFTDQKKADIYAALHYDCMVKEIAVDNIEVDTTQKPIKYARVYYVPFDKRPFRSITIENGIDGHVNFEGNKLSLSAHYCFINATCDEEVKKIFYREYTKLMNEYLIEQGGI